MARYHAALIMLTLGAILSGCGTRDLLGDKRHHDGLTVAAQQPAGGELPAPSDLLKAASGAGDAELDGAAFVPEWPQHNVTVDGTAAVYEPAAGDPPELADMAYAIYRFDLSAVEPQPWLLLDWLTAPAAADLWVAFSDWEHDRWVWYHPGDAGQCTPESFCGCINSEGSLLVVLALGGGSSASLSSLRIPALADSWRTLGHDRQHTGSSPYQGPPADYVRWSYTVGAAYGVLTSPVIWVDGTVYVGADTDTGSSLYAFNPDGSVKWTCALASDLIAPGSEYCSPTIGADGTVYICGQSPDMIYAVGADGALKWSHEISEYSLVVIAKDGTIYVCSWAPMAIHAFLPDGTLKWERETDLYYMLPPAVDDAGNLYVCGGGLYAFNPDGTDKWNIVTEGNTSPPAIGADGTVYFANTPFSDMESTLYAVHPDGSIKWTQQLTESVAQCPVLGVDGTVFVARDNWLYALNADGTEKWVCETNGNINTFMALDAAGTVYLSAYHNYFCAISAAGELIWERWLSDAPDSNSAAAIGADGCLYVASYNSIVAFGPTNGSYSISGRVVDQGGDGLAAVQLKFDSSIAPVFTDAEGYWSAQGVGDGTYRVTPGLAGYTFTPPYLDVTVSGADTAVADFTGQAAGPGDWWCFGRDRRHTRRSPYCGAQTGHVRWAYTTSGNVQSSPVIGANGTVYVGSYDRKLYAICPDGEKKWSCASGIITTSPALGLDGTVYFATRSESSVIHAVNSDGTSKWYYAVGGYGGDSSPALSLDGTIYLIGSRTRLFALDPGGALDWDFQLDGQSFSSPSIGETGLVYLGGQRNLYCVNPDGTENWSYASAASIFVSAPAIAADGTVYFGIEANSLYALHADGTLRWVFQTGGPVFSSPALGADGTVYIGCSDNSMYAVNPDGTQRWAYATGGAIQSSPAVGADGVVYFGSEDHSVYAVNPDGSLLWSYATGDDVESSPALAADGTVYIGSNDDKLYAFHDE